MTEKELKELDSKYHLSWADSVSDKAKNKEKEWGFHGRAYFTIKPLLDKLPSPKKYKNHEEMIEDYSRIMATDYLLEAYQGTTRNLLASKGFCFEEGIIYVLEEEDCWREVHHSDSVLLEEYIQGLVAYDEEKVYIYHQGNDPSDTDIEVAYRFVWMFEKNHKRNRMESLIKKFADLGAKQEELEKELEKVKDERFELKLKLMEIGYVFPEKAVQIKYVEATELENYIKILKEAIDLVKNNQKEDDKT